MKRRADPEFQHQCSLFKWARLPAVVRQYPALRLLEASMNGVRLTPAQAGKAKAAGMLKGQHDIRLPVARGPYIGLSIELKVGKNTPTDDQLQVGQWLEEEGWCVRYAWGWLAAKEEILAYLALPPRAQSGSSAETDGMIQQSDQ